MDVAKPQRRALGRRGGRLAPAGALGGSLRATPLARVRAGAWRRRRRGVAQAKGNCAIVRNVGFRTRRPAARGEVQAAAWRIGWVGAARPTGICAIVHNLVGDASRTAPNDRRRSGRQVSGGA